MDILQSLYLRMLIPSLLRYTYHLVIVVSKIAIPKVPSNNDLPLFLDERHELSNAHVLRIGASYLYLSLATQSRQL